MSRSPDRINSRRGLFSSVKFYLLLSSLMVCSSAAAQTAGPIIERCTPTRGAAKSVLEVAGYRLGAEDMAKVKVYFIRGQLRLSAGMSGTSSTTNDVQGGPQTLDVIVPEKITPGEWQMLIEVRGQKTAPVPIQITEWTPPQLERLSHTRAQRGDVISIYGSNIHIDDEIELTDAQGQVRRFSAGADSSGTGFTVPADLPEGELTVRVGLTVNGADSFSQPLKLVVTSGPLPLELWGSAMDPVAPGQWADLVFNSTKTLEQSERTEVEFRQGEQLVIAPTQQPDAARVRVRVPVALAPGAVELRTRTWRDGVASEWSEPQAYRLLDAPVSPLVEALEVGAEPRQIHLWEGPDRPRSFDAHAGEAIIFRGRFYMEHAGELRVTLRGPGGQLSLPAVDVERGFQVQLPANVRRGNWRLSIEDATTGKGSQLPVVMRVN